MIHSIAWWPTVIVVGIATLTDLRSRRIPNWLVLPFLILGFGVSSWVGGWHGLGQSAEGFGLGLLVFGALFWMGGMGAGDVKLCAAVGAWIGPRQLSIALVLTALAGGLLVLVWALIGGFMKELFLSTGNLLLGRKKEKVETAPATDGEVQQPSKKRKIPYAPAIAVGTILSFFAR